MRTWATLFKERNMIFVKTKKFSYMVWLCTRSSKTGELLYLETIHMDILSDFLPKWIYERIVNGPSVVEVDVPEPQE